MTDGREPVPFRVVTADGETIDLTYSSPRPAEEHDEMALLGETPWFEPGKPLRNFMLHETDFYDEVEQIWGRRWGAEGIGKLREVLVSRPTENEIRPEYADEWQYYYSSAAGNADLGKLQAQFDEYREAGLTTVALNPSPPNVWFPLYQGHVPDSALAKIPEFSFPAYLGVIDATLDLAGT